MMAYRLLNKERQTYLRENAEEPLRRINRLVFDFDGVLVQTSQSYRQTIRKVVDYYFLEILSLEGEDGKLATLRDIQKFKDTGLYNNDWNLSYAFITYYLNLILRELEQKSAFSHFTKRFLNLQFSNAENFIQKLREVSNFLKQNGVGGKALANMKNNDVVGLDLFLAQLNSEKPKTIVTSLMGVDPEVENEKQRLVKQLIPYNLEKPDLLKRLFEEAYLGRELFNKFYGLPSLFKFDESFIDKETLTPTKETLDVLRQEFGKFGIYSGRPRTQGMYILEKYTCAEYFDEAESVFLGDLLKSEAEMERLGKPDPTLFIELVEKSLGNVSGVAYVGDGIADALLVENARSEGLENLLFLGVLSSSEDSNKLFTEYAKHGADAVMMDVNDIPEILSSLEGSD
jgi:phosphoglycolate phosphatase-like HAD superfamily hydrolase